MMFRIDFEYILMHFSLLDLLKSIPEFPRMSFCKRLEKQGESVRWFNVSSQIEFYGSSEDQKSSFPMQLNPKRVPSPLYYRLGTHFHTIGFQQLCNYFGCYWMDLLEQIWSDRQKKSDSSRTKVSSCQISRNLLYSQYSLRNLILEILTRLQHFVAAIV